MDLRATQVPPETKDHLEILDLKVTQDRKVLKAPPDHRGPRAPQDRRALKDLQDRSSLIKMAA